MNRILALTAPLFGALVILSGCGPQSEVALSADGKWIARTVPGQGLYMRPSQSAKARLILKKPDLNSPCFSPDGTRVAVENTPEPRTVTTRHGTKSIPGAPQTTWIVDRRRARAKRLPVRLTSPFAWSADGRQLLGWLDDNHAAAVDVRQGQVSRRVAVPRASMVLWLSDGAWALADDHLIRLVRRDSIESLSFPGSIVRSISARGPIVYWCESRGDDLWPLNEDVDSEIQIGSVDTRTGARTIVYSFHRVANLFNGTAAMAGGEAFAPAGGRIAMNVLVIDSPPDEYRKYVALEKEANASQDPKKFAAVKLMERSLRARMMTVALDSKAGTVDQLLSVSTPFGADDTKNPFRREFAWSGDGRALALVFEDHTEVRRL